MEKATENRSHKLWQFIAIKGEIAVENHGDPPTHTHQKNELYSDIPTFQHFRIKCGL